VSFFDNESNVLPKDTNEKRTIADAKIVFFISQK
jgi:hypothetical protein